MLLMFSKNKVWKLKANADELYGAEEKKVEKSRIRYKLGSRVRAHTANITLRLSDVDKVDK